jgi:cytochrome c oxidase subunit I
MLVLSMPWHLVGLLGMPRRMAYYDYTHPEIQPQAWTVIASTLGGLLLVVSAFLLVFILARAHRSAAKRTPEPYTFSAVAHAGGRTPVVLNGFGLWVAMMIGLTVVNYGFPIAQLAILKDASVPVIPIGSR